MYPKILLTFIFFVTLSSCKDSKEMIQNVEIQGHRGCRGLMPENTINAFKLALDIGVNTLELDVVISADSQVVVSHEAYMNHEIVTLQNGDTIKQEEEMSYNLYAMTYDEIKKYDVGMKFHPRFPIQKKEAAIKPLLSEVLTISDGYATMKARPLPNYNIEIKTQNDEATAYNPDDTTFVNLVLLEIRKAGVQDRTTIQSFDHDILAKCHELYPLMKYVMLVEDSISMDSHLSKIGFIPYGYSPYYGLVDNALVNKCHENKIKLVPWTVNEPSEVEKLIKLGVDGIITDFPDMAIEVRESLLPNH